METTTTYDPALVSLAAIAVADLWAEQIQKPINKDNGDDNGMLFTIVTQGTMKAQDNITPAKIALFRAELIEQIEGYFSDNVTRSRHSIDHSVDYGPCQYLAKACQVAGIDTMCLPWKSNTHIRIEKNLIYYKFGYSSSHQSKSIC